MILCITLNPNLDKTLTVPRLGPGGVIRGTNLTTVASGKGVNAARILRNLGHDVRVLNLVGGATGDWFCRLLTQDDHLEGECLRIAQPTREVLTLRKQGSNEQTAFVEPGPDVTEYELQMLTAALEREADRYEWILFCGSAPCERVGQAHARLVEIARSAGARVVLDTRGSALRTGIHSIPCMVKPNLAEAEELVGHELADEASRLAFLANLCSHGIEISVLSCGAQSLLALAHGQRFRAHPPQVDTVNPIGCGDAFVAGMVHALANDCEFRDALRWGVAAGAANAAMWEAGRCTREQIEAMLAGVRIEDI